MTDRSGRYIPAGTQRSQAGAFVPKDWPAHHDTAVERLYSPQPPAAPPPLVREEGDSESKPSSARASRQKNSAAYADAAAMLVSLDRARQEPPVPTTIRKHLDAAEMFHRPYGRRGVSRPNTAPLVRRRRTPSPDKQSPPPKEKSREKKKPPVPRFRSRVSTLEQSVWGAEAPVHAKEKIDLAKRTYSLGPAQSLPFHEWVHNRLKSERSELHKVCRLDMTRAECSDTAVCNAVLARLDGEFRKAFCCPPRVRFILGEYGDVFLTGVDRHEFQELVAKYSEAALDLVKNNAENVLSRYRSIFSERERKHIGKSLGLKVTKGGNGGSPTFAVGRQSSRAATSVGIAAGS